jgi:hypothetical protein
MTPALTRRRDRSSLHHEAWHVYYGDVRVGSISKQVGTLGTEGWRWACGFYPGMEPPHQEGIVGTFELARSAFEQAWKCILPTLTEAQFQEWRRDRDFHVAIRAKPDRGEKLSTEIATSMMRCVCGVMFDSHQPEESYEHRGHIYAAQAGAHRRRG